MVCSSLRSATNKSSDTWSNFIGGSRELSRVTLVHIGFVPFNNVILLTFIPNPVED